VRVVTCMGASGIFVPPLLVFPKKNMKLDLLDGTPPPARQNWRMPPLRVDTIEHFHEVVPTFHCKCETLI
jgi:hypothetical protein